MKILLNLFVILFLISSNSWAGILCSGDLDYIDITDIPSGDLTIYAVARRDIDTASSGSGRVQEVFATRSTNDGIEFNLGNFFGGDANKNKPRLGIFGSGSRDGFWIDGVKQASASIADSSTINGVFNTYVGVWSSAAVGDISRICQGGNVAIPEFFLTGAVLELAIFSFAFTDAQAVDISTSGVKQFAFQHDLSTIFAYFALDDFEDGTALSTITDGYRDSSGNGRHGTGVDANTNSLNIAESVLTYP